MDEVLVSGDEHLESSLLGLVEKIAVRRAGPTHLIRWLDGVV